MELIAIPKATALREQASHTIPALTNKRLTIAVAMLP